MSKKYTFGMIFGFMMLGSLITMFGSLGVVALGNYNLGMMVLWISYLVCTISAILWVFLCDVGRILER